MAVGFDELPTELVNPAMIKVLYKQYNEIVESGEGPTDWQRSVFLLCLRYLPAVIANSTIRSH